MSSIPRVAKPETIKHALDALWNERRRNGRLNDTYREPDLNYVNRAKAMQYVHQSGQPFEGLITYTDTRIITE